MGKKICEPLQSLKENEGILDKKIEELSCRENDIKEDLETGKLQSGKMPKREVELWLKNVQNIKDDVRDIKKKLEEVRWTHFHLRINLAKQVEEKIKEAVELRENGRFQEGLFVSLFRGSTYTFPPTKLVGGTALRNLKRIEECLMNDQIGKIGIYGMGGVGKTTIMTNIHNNIKNAGTFDRVIWVTVSKESNLKKLQDDVSKELCLSLSNTEDALRRSAEIFMALNLIGKFLLILDDMWRPFSLTKIGIPEPNEENKCKIVWTTRSKKVCQGMGSERIIEVDGLTEDESWTLFKEKLGANFVLSLEIESIAKAIVKECDGLPLAIITIGAALRDEDDVRIWRNASEDLKNSSFDLEGLENDVFSCLKFSFDHLKTQIHQHCFLYCALYPEDYQIACDSLIENWIADGIFDEVEDREKGFDKGYTIINDLKDACMLENGKHGGLDISFVKMHDLLRDLAIAITKKIYLFVVKVRSKVGEFPRNENLMGDAIRVSLMYSDIKMLSCQSKCPKLSTLLLEGSRLGNIDHLFFEHMQNLRVLDLSRTCIKFLPQSLSNLVNLHALLLRDCWKLTEVPSVVQLTELRVLNLTGTAIRYLPDGMDGLTNLRCLGLSATKSLEMVPIGTISSFSHLEELSMVESKWKWSSNENRNGRGASVEDIVSLMHLKKLLVDFIDLSALSSYVRSGHWRGLNCFVLTVGYECAFVDVTDLQNNFYSRERQVYVSGIDCKNSVAFPESNLTELVISDLQNLSTIYMEEPTQGDNLANLKYIHIENCPKLRYVFSVGWLQTLQNLECIRVSSCKAMEEMVDDLLEWENPNTKLHVNTLANLKYIHISNCPKLKYVLSVGWFQTLQNLEEISVLGCQAMEEMVVDMGDFGEANNNINITLPRLEKLTLADLPKLKSICKKILICSSLENITALYCPMLKMLPFSINSIPSSLKHILGSRRWWDSLDWDNHDTKMHLQPFLLDMFGEEEERRGTKRKADDS
ncbi:putative disease resistance protein isoform X1 [Cinnamomum micranthum f. kanehirae]|uniref:Putative disease resistance protein isoform X1 n=1 Tax=Cinnamomum micranthum f. kanehirae TaxID=337451 RepID=A0A443PJ38_9MAGN|nr:putative disease resistance protein isoform X1 [Cinnamomum micranthum f. kanehirae]